jgi:hypothetical protein
MIVTKWMDQKAGRSGETMKDECLLRYLSNDSVFSIIINLFCVPSSADMKQVFACATEAWGLKSSRSLCGISSKAGLGWTNPAQRDCAPWQAVTEPDLEALGLLARAGSYVKQPPGHALGSHHHCTARRDVKPVSECRIDSSMHRPHSGLERRNSI